MTGRLSRADELRRHRETFIYAREHGLSLRDAEKAMARERSLAAQARLDVIQRCGRGAAQAAPIGAEQPQRAVPEDAPWMMRD